ENVPRLLQALPARLPLRRIGINEDGYFNLPRMAVFNSADFGVPQKRLRLFCGRYPDPTQTHAEKPVATLDGAALRPWAPLRAVIEAFPNPLGKPATDKRVRDPFYDISLEETELSGHFRVGCVMTAGEAERNR